MFDFEKLSASKFYVAPTSERVVEFSPSDVDMTNVAKVFAAGDIVNGGKTVVEAVAAGKEAAAAIAAYLEKGVK